MKYKNLSAFVMIIILSMTLVYSLDEFPEGYEIDEDKLGNTVFKNKFAKDKSINIGGEEYNLDLGAELKVSQDLRKYTLLGKADLRIGDEQFLEGIEDGFIELGEDEKVIYAEFFSPKGGIYGFEYNGEFYQIDAKPGTKVIFDSKNKKITTESFLIKGDQESKVYIGNNQITGKDIDIELNENGEVKYAKVKDGSYTHNGKTYNSIGELEVYNDGTDVSNKDSAISIKGNIIQIKGLVSMSNGLSYESLSRETLTEFNEGLNLFDIIEGDLRLSNSKHSVTILDGIARLSFNEGFAISDELESFRYVHSNKYGLDEYGFLDETDGNFVMSSYVNGKIKVKSISFEEYRGLLNQPVTIENTIAGLESELELLTEINAPLGKIGDAKTKLQIAKNSLLVEEGHIDGAIEQTRSLLVDSSISETLNKDYLQVSLAELEIQRAFNIGGKQKSLLDEALSGGDISADIDLVLTKSIFDEKENAIQRLMEIRDGAIGLDNQDLYESSTFVLADAYTKNKEFEKAAFEYRKMSNSVQDSRTLSEVNRLLGSSELQEGNVALALKAYEEAHRANPSNIRAKQDLVQLRVNTLKAISSGLNLGTEQLGKRFWREIGINTDGSIQWNIRAVMPPELQDQLSNQFGSLRDNIDNQNMGTLALMAVASEGYDLERFYQLSESKKADKIMEALPRISRSNAVSFARSTVGLPRKNSDIALLVGRGDYANSQIYGKHNSPEFKFQTGEGYVNPEILEDTWKDIVLDEINLKNVALIFAPEALITLGGRSLTVGGWAARGTGAILGTSTKGSRVLSGINKIKSIPGVATGSTRTLIELGLGIGHSQISPKYTNDIISVFAGRLGVRGVRRVTQRVLLTADNRVLPHFVAETSGQLEEVTKDARKISNNLYQDSSGRQFVASVGEINIPGTISNDESLNTFISNVRKNNYKLYKDRGLQATSDSKVYDIDELWIDPNTKAVIPEENRNLDLYHSLRAKEDSRNIGYFEEHIDRNGRFAPGGELASGRYSWGIDEDGRFIYFSDEYFNHKLALKNKQAFGAGEVEIVDGRFNIELIEDNIPIGAKSGHYRRFGDVEYDANSIDRFRERARGIGWSSIDDSSTKVTIGNSKFVASFRMDDFSDFTSARVSGVQNTLNIHSNTIPIGLRKFSSLDDEYKFVRSHGQARTVQFSEYDQSQSWDTYYHAYPIGSNLDFSSGLDPSKSTGGFFFARTASESKDALEIKGFNREDIEVIRVRVLRNVNDQSSRRPLVREAATTDVDGYLIRTEEYNQFNRHLNEGLVRLETLN